MIRDKLTIFKICLVESHGSSVACMRPPQVRCQTVADPDQWDWNFREALHG